MATASFEELSKGLCELLGETPPPLAAQGLRGFCVMLNDVEVNIFHDPRRNPGCAFVSTTFGDLPPQRALSAVQALMEANHDMAGPGAPVFSMNPASGLVHLQYALPFSDGATVVDLYQNLQMMAQHVRQWTREPLAPAADSVA